MNEIGKPFRTDGGGIYRVDIWTSDKDGQTYHERRACANMQDQSEMAYGFHGSDDGNVKYHPACECCWIGHSHTVALHNSQTLNPDGTVKPWPKD